MKVTLESTDKLVELNGVPARVWEGKTERGIPVFAFVALLAPAIINPPADVCAEFERDLEETRPPSLLVSGVIPSRLIL